MPLMTIRTSADLGQADVPALLHACSEKLASLAGKPESYVMTLLDRVTAMTMSGTDEPACLVEIRSVGKLSGDQTKAMSQAFCVLLEERLGVSQRRIFLNFTDFSGGMWGFNGSTFG
jgi:hypothetical protein